LRGKEGKTFCEGGNSPFTRPVHAFWEGATRRGLTNLGDVGPLGEGKKSVRRLRKRERKDSPGGGHWPARLFDLLQKEAGSDLKAGFPRKRRGEGKTCRETHSGFP